MHFKLISFGAAEYEYEFLVTLAYGLLLSEQDGNTLRDMRDRKLIDKGDGIRLVMRYGFMS